MAQSVKLGITLPSDLVSFADEIAREEQTSRSGAIAQCLAEAARRRREALMEEGYRAMAGEHQEFADMAAEIAREVVPEW